VISNATAQAYAGKPLNVAEIGIELHVRYILEGSVRLLGDRLRVAVSLIDASTTAIVWSAAVERGGADQHTVQDEIVARVARELQIEILPIESRHRSGDRNAVSVAFQGWAALQAANASNRLDHYERAARYFTEALQRDPGLISAQVGMGAYFACLGAKRLVADHASYLAKAREIPSVVVQKAPDHAGGHHFLGAVLAGTGHLEESLLSFDRSIAPL
jgi:hypothetical protein